MPNQSKVKEWRFWDLWRRSGAVTGVHGQSAPLSPLKIVGISECFHGYAAGYTTLSLSERQIGPNSYEPMCCVVVPSSSVYKINDVLPEIPRNAVPVDIFFLKRDMRRNSR